MLSLINRENNLTSSLANLYLLFYACYLVVPVFQYFVIGIGDPYDSHFTQSNFVAYTIEFILFLIIYFLLNKNIKKFKKVKLSFNIGIDQLLLILSLGSLFLIMQFVYTEAYIYSNIDRTLGLTKFHSIPEIYTYLFMPAYVMICYRINELSRFQKIWFVICVFIYLIIWFDLGSRGELLVVLIFWIVTRPKGLFSLTTMVFGITLVAVILYASVSSRWNKEGVNEVVSVVLENPQALSLADLEFAWGLRNYNKLTEVNFKFDYRLESHLEGFLKGPAKLMGVTVDDPANRFRYLYNSERVKNGATYGGTGFSFFYEARQAFGLFSWLQYVIFWSIVLFVSSNLAHSNFLQVYAALLFPNLLTLIRAGFPIGMIVTKFVYTWLLILTMLTIRKIITFKR